MTPEIPELSAVAIMKNEADNLPGLLANLKGLVGELVLVDDGSTDASVDLAQAAGDWVKIVSRVMDPETGFAGQRNAGIEAASGEWLLHMDCDERVPRALADEIAAALPGASENAFRYRRLNYFLNRPMRHGGWQSWNRPQLARRGLHRFEGRLHERCVIDGDDKQTGQLDGHMHHLNDPDYVYRLEKSHRYVLMEVERMQESGQRTGPVRILMAPAVEFAKKYIFKLGILDGTAGLIAALHSATAVFRAHAVLWDRTHALERGDLEHEFSNRS